MDPYSAQTYPPPSSSQVQPHNQDPYLYNQQYNQSQQYPYYPQIPQQQQYPNPNAVYQHPEQEHAPIHPPGVPVQNDPNHIAAYQHGYGQAHFQTDPNSYYPQHQQQQPQLGYPDASLMQQGQHQWQQQAPTGDYGRNSSYLSNGQVQSFRGGRGFRGGGSSFRGRGRGRIGKTSVGQPKPACVAWCELCRVDCNTLEILENHKNGKKHKKNLKVQEELQKLAAKTHETQMAAPEKPENSSLPDGNKVESRPAESEEQRNGLKRKMRDGARKSAEPSKKSKEIVPFICELCNVKCESAPTFDSHLKGKKHIFNLQQFQEQQATLGQAALQALYPALEALYPALLQALSQTNPNASTSANGGLDQQVLQWLQPFLPQTGPAVLPQGPEAAAAPPAVGPQGPNLGGTQDPAMGPQGPDLGGTQEAPTETAETRVEPVNEVKEPEPKAEDQAEPKSKIENVDSTTAEPTE